jgi:hypothetical protein
MNEPLETDSPVLDDVLGLTDEKARQLTEEATRLDLPVQEPPARFEEAMEYVFQKNSELYRRLA